MNPFIEARNAGLSPFPVRKGTKVPAISWKQFQSEICTAMQATEWGNGGGYSIGIATGEVSGRLMAIDIEASFMPRIAELGQRMAAAGVRAVFDSWVSGYSESTPRGGLHVLVRLEGEGSCPPNQVFARGDDKGVLIETRGEGGYVLVAPSPGYVVTGGGFDSIVYCTLEEWQVVEAVLRSFDVSPQHAPALTVPTRSTVGFGDSLRLDGESWLEPIKAGLPPIRSLLEDRGWIFPGSSDEFGEHCVRPGKDPREGHSANLSRDGYLWVHSTNAGLPVGVGLDAVDLLICWSTGQQVKPSKDDRTDWFKAQRPAADRGAGASPVTSEVAVLNLSPDFWAARGYLAHIEQAALSMRLSPDAVWEGVKCFYAATIPWNHRLPGDGTMDYISIVVGPPGRGKSRAQHTAWRLLEAAHSLPGVHFPVPVGSGEGMTEVFVNRDDKEKRYKARGAGFYADEGKFLLDIDQRLGNTTMQVIKQMWSGELTGTVAATADRHRWLEPRAVRGTVLISTTPDIATEFMRNDLTGEGLPQRISWGWATYPHPDTAPDWPGPLNVQLWDATRADGIYELDYQPELKHLIDARILAAARGEASSLEGHATYATAKTAAIHSHLDGRLNITMADWALAVQDWETTRSIRTHLQTSQKTATMDKNVAIGQARAHQKIAESNEHLERAVEALKRKLKQAKQPITRRELKTSLRYVKQRYGISHHEILNVAIHRGWAQEAPDGGIERGPT